MSYDASAPLFLGLALSLGLVSLLAVILRFVARYQSKARLGLDDFFSVISLFGCFGVLGAIAWSSFAFRDLL